MSSNPMHCYACVDPAGVLVVVLPQPTLSLNQLLNQHHHKRTADKRTWEKLLLVASGPVRKPREIRMRLDIERHGSRELDPDNLRGGMKPLIDAIRRHGLIFDDNPKWLDLHTCHVQAKRLDAHTVIRISEIL